MQHMDTDTARKLNEITSDFYARCAASFDATRQQPWAGWEHCVDLAQDRLGWPESMRVLDIGCGNMRFEDYLAEATGALLDVWAVDNRPDLVDLECDMRFEDFDVIEALALGEDLEGALDVPRCDLVCAFGLFHHVPGQDARWELLDFMLGRTRPGGLVMITLWQFERDERLARKAEAETRRALERFPKLRLDQGDRLLGWQDERDALRYCHSFSDEEIDELVNLASERATLVERFSSDGKSGDLNCYVVFEVE